MFGMLGPFLFGLGALIITLFINKEAKDNGRTLGWLAIHIGLIVLPLVRWYFDHSFGLNVLTWFIGYGLAVSFTARWFKPRRKDQVHA